MNHYPTKSRFISLSILFACVSYECSAIHVSSFGALPNDNIDDTAAINEAIIHCKSNDIGELKFNNGIYDISVNEATEDKNFGDRECIEITGLNNFTISGNGARLRFSGSDQTEYAHAVCISDSNNITIKGIKVFWKHTHFTVGTVVGKGSDFIDFSISNDFPVVSVPDFHIQRAQEIDSSSGLLDDDGVNFPKTGNNSDYGREFQSLANGNARMYLFPSDDSSELSKVQIGTEYLLSHKVFGADAFKVKNCNNLSFDSVTVFNTAGRAVDLTSCENITVKKFVVEPLEFNYPVSAASAALRVKEPRGNVEVRDSTFRRQGDDGININGFYLRFVKKLSNKKFIVSKYNSEFNPEASDYLCLVDPNAQPIWDGAISSVKKLDNGKLELTLSKALKNNSLTNQYQFINTTKLPDSVVIRNSTFKESRGRGVFIQSENSRIEDCEFEDITGSAIIAPVYYNGKTSESQAANFLVIDNNTILNCPRKRNNNAAIGIVCKRFNNSDYCPAGAIINVEITNNSITNSPNMGVFATSVDGLTITGNDFTNISYDPMLSKWLGLADNTIALVYCKNYEMEFPPNSYSGSTTGGVAIVE